MIQNNYNNNLSVLPWYASKEEQNHRKSYAYGNIYPLFSPPDKLLPFQILKETGTVRAFSISIYDKDDKLVAILSQEMVNDQVRNVRFPDYGYDVIVCPGMFSLGMGLADGIYYAVLIDSYQNQRWYSEMFTVVQDLSPYLKVEWWNRDDLVFDAGRIVYKNPQFKNVLYLKTELGKPEYVFEEEGEERDGYFFPEKQISEKTYKCTALAPEYLCDAMRLIRMADYVRVTDKYGRVYDCDTFLITPKWQEQGDLASVEMEFETATVVKRNGRAVLLDVGDFDNDFNNDFYKQ